MTYWRGRRRRVRSYVREMQARPPARQPAAALPLLLDIACDWRLCRELHEAIRASHRAS